MTGGAGKTPAERAALAKAKGWATKPLLPVKAPAAASGEMKLGWHTAAGECERDSSCMMLRMLLQCHYACITCLHAFDDHIKHNDVIMIMHDALGA